jgi:3-phenylpropionate/trans-cinnamate dioxygenase ferredoxin subunit
MTSPASGGPAGQDTAGDTGERKFVRACALADVPENGALGVDVNGTPVAVVRAEGEVHALHDVCSHAEVPLSEGEVYDHTIECWLHGSCFDVRTGLPTGPPATQPVPVYPVKTEDGDVYVALT